ncbi:MAG: histidine kinase sensor protein [Bacteroidota bacterium]|jgi:PAS domain S-box-containing protein
MNQEFFYKALVDSLPDMVWAFDTNFKLVVANAAFIDMRRSLYGKPIKIGDDIFSHVSDEAVNRWKPLYQKALNGDRIIEEDPRQIQGINVIRRLSLNPVYNNENEIIGCMGITYDITNEAFLEMKLTAAIENHHQLIQTIRQQLNLPLANFYNLSNKLLDTKNYSQSDQSTMVFLINEELNKIGNKLKEFKEIIDK